MRNAYLNLAFTVICYSSSFFIPSVVRLQGKEIFSTQEPLWLIGEKFQNGSPKGLLQKTCVLWAECWHSPRFICWDLILSVTILRSGFLEKWLSHEDSRDGIKVPLSIPFAPFLPYEDASRKWCFGSREEALPGHWMCWHPAGGLCPP